MSKYIIELKDDIQVVQKVGVTENGNAFIMNFYKDQLEKLNSDYINEHYGQLQQDAYDKGYKDGRNVTETQAHDDAYQRGLEDAWEAARKILKMPDPPYWGVFDEYKDDLFRKITAAEAIEKLKVYEEKQKADNEIKVGDEVRHDGGHIFVVTAVDDISVYGIDGTGDFKHSLKCNVHRTDRHFDIEKILKEMKGDNDK